MLEDLESAPISEKDRTLYAFIKKMVSDSTSIGPSDVERARQAGWSDEALYDAITVCSLFQFYNNWIDATGVSDMSEFGYEMSGHRLATEGYAQGGPQPENSSRSRRAKSSRSRTTPRARSTKSKKSSKSKSRK